MLRPAYEKYEHFYVINERIELPVDMVGKTYFIRHSERDLLFFANLLEAYRILRKRKPDLILSTGAGPLVPFAMVGRLLGIGSIFVEDANRAIEPSLTGRIVYRLGARVFYQWRELESFFPKGTYGGTLV